MEDEPLVKIFLGELSSDSFKDLFGATFEELPPFVSVGTNSRSSFSSVYLYLDRIKFNTTEVQGKVKLIISTLLKAYIELQKGDFDWFDGEYSAVYKYLEYARRHDDSLLRYIPCHLLELDIPPSRVNRHDSISRWHSTGVKVVTNLSDAWWRENVNGLQIDENECIFSTIVDVRSDRLIPYEKDQYNVEGIYIALDEEHTCIYIPEDVEFINTCAKVSYVVYRSPVTNVLYCDFLCEGASRGNVHLKQMIRVVLPPSGHSPKIFYGNYVFRSVISGIPVPCVEVQTLKCARLLSWKEIPMFVVYSFTGINTSLPVDITDCSKQWRWLQKVEEAGEVRLLWFWYKQRYQGFPNLMNLLELDYQDEYSERFIEVRRENDSTNRIVPIRLGTSSIKITVSLDTTFCVFCQLLKRDMPGYEPLLSSLDSKTTKSSLLWYVGLEWDEASSTFQCDVVKRD